MSDYSPQADALLNQWICLSQNMRSAIARAKYLQRIAVDTGEVVSLERQLREKRVNALYREIGREMRSMMSAEGIEKSFPEIENPGGDSAGGTHPDQIGSASPPSFQNMTGEISPTVSPMSSTRISSGRSIAVKKKLIRRELVMVTFFIVRSWTLRASSGLQAETQPPSGSTTRRYTR